MKNATKTKDNPKKQTTKYSKTKLAWFGRLIRLLAWKRGGLILQRFRAHTGVVKICGKIEEGIIGF